MELSEAIRRRRMVRAFAPVPVAPEVLDRVLGAALRGPSAGNAQGLDLVVLEGDETARYWDTCLPQAARSSFPWPGLLDAPVLVLLLTRSDTYVTRYAEPDKVGTGLGEGAATWPVPYWYVDGGMAAMLLLLAAVDEGLGALFFGVFAREAELLATLGVPDGHRPIGMVALGHPTTDRPSRSAGRPRRSIDEAVHRGGW